MIKPRNPVSRTTRIAASQLLLVAVAVLVGAGCSKKLVTQLVPNQPPEVRLATAPVRSDPNRPDFYAYTMQWSGYDPDGRVDHFVYAIDPESLTYSPADTTWHNTVKNEQLF